MTILKSNILGILKSLINKFLKDEKPDDLDFIISLKKLLDNIHILPYDGTEIVKDSTIWRVTKSYLYTISVSELINYLEELELIDKDHFSNREVKLIKLCEGNSDNESLYPYGDNIELFRINSELIIKSKLCGVDIVSPHDESKVLGKVFDIKVIEVNDTHTVSGDVMFYSEAKNLTNLDKVDIEIPIAKIILQPEGVDARMVLTERMYFKYITKG